MRPEFLRPFSRRFIRITMDEEKIARVESQGMLDTSLKSRWASQGRKVWPKRSNWA
jgi:hypothetical protein